MKKLSEYIRKGCELAPQAFGHYRESSAHLCATCALGSAIDALFKNWCEESKLSYTENINSARFSLSLLNDLIGYEASKIFVLLPNNVKFDDTRMKIINGNQGRLTDTIIYLNDHVKWSREAIADWVESVGY